jgi:hypothetical protein
MNKNIKFHVSLILLLLTQYSVAQVDVVYSDLVWSDEFETNGVVSVEKWFHQTQYHRQWKLV